MRVADFFCGGGGFSEGFRQAGFEIVFAVDKWAPAVMTYKGNKPGVNVIQDNIIYISQLPDEEFDAMVPDSEVIIGSPPCQAFSHSNKSGNADKALGIELIEAYLRIVARKKYKQNSILRYWVLENVPNVKNYIKDEYSSKDLGLEGDFVLRPKDGASGFYNAKYFGAPTNRKRYLCGEFPEPIKTHNDETVITLRAVLNSLGDPLDDTKQVIQDVNYAGLALPREEVSDHQYIHELAPFEWNTAKRLKQDRGYMGRMAFPEDFDRPSRTVMATISASSRESMILQYGREKYRLPTVREAASMMSFPIDYRFYGKSRGIKHTLVGNAVPPKMSYAVAKAIALAAGIPIPEKYIPIHHDSEIDFVELNGEEIPVKGERSKRKVAKFKYHIPYLIYATYRVELTNYHSDFENMHFIWDAELHFSQGREKAAVFSLSVNLNSIKKEYHEPIKAYLYKIRPKLFSYDRFQELYCMTADQRLAVNAWGPYELLNDIKIFIDSLIPKKEQANMVPTGGNPPQLPQAILVGKYLLSNIVTTMGGLE